MSPTAPYVPTHPIRLVTSASLFDGHDAAINIMRRILQASGAEVIHLGHNRSVQEIVDCAIQEDVQGIAITSYQGGHVEYFKYMVDLLAERGANIKVFGGGGGTILPSEIEALHAHGVARIYSPDDGRSMGLQGMISDLLSQCDFATRSVEDVAQALPMVDEHSPAAIGALITVAENLPQAREALRAELKALIGDTVVPVLGTTVQVAKARQGRCFQTIFELKWPRSWKARKPRAKARDTYENICVYIYIYIYIYTHNVSWS